MTIEMTYLMQPAKRYTFEQPQLKKYVEQHCYGKVLNLFAGRVKLDVDEYRVDTDKDGAVADYYGDACEFLMSSNQKFDTVILDPPYNLRKSREKYAGRYIGGLTEIKNFLELVVTSHATIISLGYDTVGMSKSRGYEKIGVCVVCHSGDHNDTLVVVERKIA
jgi:hypothetical protein